MPDQAPRLTDHPRRSIVLACAKCKRRGVYAIARLSGEDEAGE